MHEKTLSSEYIYKGKILTVRKDQVTLSDGTRASREIIEHNPAVVVLPFKKPDTLYLIRQYRKAIDTLLTEATAGVVDPGEDMLTAAKRELIEETGITANQWTSLGEAFAAPGYCTEKLAFYLAEDLTFGDSRQEHDERIELVPFTIPQVEELIKTHQIIDMKTLLIYFFFLRRQNHL